MKKILSRLGSWFYKDSHLTVLRNSDSPLPDGGLIRNYTVNMLTFQPYATKTSVLSRKGDSVDLTGTYGLNPWDIFNPFKQNQNIAWLLMYQQGLIKDVTAEIIHPDKGSVMVTVNNPQVGPPYAVFYNSPLEAAIPSPLAGTRFNLSEGDSAEWVSESGIKLKVQRKGDSDNKEFLVTI
jgi:hypothetical protein